MVPPQRSQPSTRWRPRRDSISAFSSPTIAQNRSVVDKPPQRRTPNPSTHRRLHRHHRQERISPEKDRQQVIQCMPSSESESHVFMNRCRHRVGGSFAKMTTPKKTYCSSESPSRAKYSNRRNSSRLIDSCDDKSGGRAVMKSEKKTPRSSPRGSKTRQSLYGPSPTSDASINCQGNEKNPNSSKEKQPQQMAKNAADPKEKDSKSMGVRHIHRRASTGGLLNHPRPEPTLTKYPPSRNRRPLLREYSIREYRDDKKNDIYTLNDGPKSRPILTAATMGWKHSAVVCPHTDEKAPDGNDIKVPFHRTSTYQESKTIRDNRYDTDSETSDSRNRDDLVRIAANEAIPFTPVPIHPSPRTHLRHLSLPLPSRCPPFVQETSCCDQAYPSNIDSDQTTSTFSSSAAISSSLSSPTSDEPTGTTLASKLVRRNSLLGSLLGNDDNMSIVSSNIEGFTCASKSTETDHSGTSSGARRLSVTFQYPLEEIMQSPVKEAVTEKVGLSLSSKTKCTFLPLPTQELHPPLFSRNLLHPPHPHQVDRSQFRRSSSMEARLSSCQSVGEEDFERVRFPLPPPPPPPRPRNRHDRQKCKNDLIVPTQSKHNNSIEMKDRVIPSKYATGFRTPPPRRRSTGFSELSAKQRPTRGNAPPPPLRRRSTML